MGILVLAALIIVGGILIYVLHDSSLEVASTAPGAGSAPSLTATPDGTASAPAATDATAGNTSDQTAPMNTAQTTTASNGLQITELAHGTGVGAANGDTVAVNYTGSLTNGTVFDSNVDPKFGHVSPFSFTLGAQQVIAGWDQGVLGMKVGEKRRLTIPASLGYGASGAGGGLIPPNATLVFDVQVTSITPQ